MLLNLAIPASHPLVTTPIAIFLIVLLIIVAVPVLLNRLKIPNVIGLIVAGIIVGPYGFNILARDMSFEVFGQVGMLYLMFLAGIEIDMYHLKRNVKRGSVFGLFTFLCPMIIGTIGSVLFLKLDLLTAVLLSSMFSAHTLIAYPIVSRFGLNRNAAVVIAIAGTILTVLGSLIVLAATVGVAREGVLDVTKIFKLLGFLALFCILVVYLYPRLTRLFFKRFNDGILQFVYVLAMVFLAAQSALFTGIEGVFGAFFAGLVLNRYVPARSPLMARIEFVGNAIFIPYFLIGVGMLINVGAFLSGWETLYVAAVMSALAMLSKWTAALITQKIFKMRSVDRSMMYQLSNAHTAVALAVVLIGFNTGLFGEAILNGTIIMILVTCTVSSLGTSRAAARMKVMMLENGADASQNASRRKPDHVLIPVDNPLTATELVNLAVMMRPPASNRSKLYALHVRNDNTAMSRSLGRNSLDVAEQVAASVDTKVIPLDRYDLNFVTGVINTIEERDIQEVIIGLHRRTNFIDSFFGDKVTQLLKATNKMVLISRCFIPVSTITRIVVSVPEKAQYETGFSHWVCAIANLTKQIGCRVIFCCYNDTRQAIRAVLKHGQYEIRAEYRTVDHWDDFILLANKIQDDDLFVVVNARRASVSFVSEMDTLPDFLRKYFAQNNLMVLYPEQFGEESNIPTMAETLSADMSATPNALWLKVMQYYRTAITLRKRLTHRHRTDKIEL